VKEEEEEEEEEEEGEDKKYIQQLCMGYAYRDGSYSFTGQSAWDLW
jgi:hypothetical protein